MSATTLKRTPSQVDSFFEYIFFLVHFTQAFVRTCPKKSVLLKFQKGYLKTPVAEFFLLDKVAHHQACNVIKKRLQRKCFTANFAKLLKAPCRTPPVSASDFNATFLTLRPWKTYIYVSPTLLFKDILSHFMFLIEVSSKYIWFHTKF